MIWYIFINFNTRLVKDGKVLSSQTISGNGERLKVYGHKQADHGNVGVPVGHGVLAAEAQGDSLTAAGVVIARLSDVDGPAQDAHGARPLGGGLRLGLGQAVR